MVSSSGTSVKNIYETMNQNCITYYKDHLDVPDLIRNLNAIKGCDFDDPYYICDLSEVIQQLMIWKRLMPRVTPFYAVKCYPHKPLLEVLAKLGTGFDCASEEEIIKILGMGVQSNRIIFANTIKQISHIQYAKKHGVVRMTFDNECELLKIQKYFPKAELVLRFRCQTKKVWVDLGQKFGCDPKTAAYYLIGLAVRLNMKVVGISFHVGTGCSDSGVFIRAIATARKLFDYYSKLGGSLTLLDIGGGFLPDPLTFRQCAEAINKGLNQYFPNNDVTVIAEPGRYLASKSFTLITKITNVSEKYVNGKHYYVYTINSGIHGGFGHIQYEPTRNAAESIQDTDHQRLYKCMIYGNTCNPADILYKNILLPKLDVDDIIIFRNFGAYSAVLATEFNGFLVPQIKTFINVKHEDITVGNAWRRETKV